MSANFTPEKEDLKILTPFKMQVLTNFPYIEADFDALTNYQLLCKVVEYLNNVIAETNEVTEQTLSLYNAYVSLENYVNTYFENLDVQEEINNKLDEMAENGTLIEILGEYLKIVTPEMFGAKGDGIADDTEALNKALKYNNVQFGENAIYYITDKLSVKSKYVNGNNATINANLNKSSIDAVFDLYYHRYEDQIVEASLNKGDTSLTVSLLNDPSNKLIMILSNESVYTGSSATKGIIRYCTKYESGVLYFNEPTPIDMTVSKISIYDDSYIGIIKDLTININNSQRYLYGVRGLFCRNCIIDNVNVFSNDGLRGIALQGYKCKIKNCTVDGFTDINLIENRTGYGINADGLNNIIENCHVTNCKHCIACGGSVFISENITYKNNYVMNKYLDSNNQYHQACMDFHPTTYGALCIGNIIEKENSHFTNPVLNASGSDIIVSNNKFITGDLSRIYCGPTTDNLTIIGNQSNGMIDLYQSNERSTPYNNYLISNNINIGIDATKTIHNVTYTNNIYGRINYHLAGDNWIIQNNIIKPASYGTNQICGIYIGDNAEGKVVTHAIIKNNIVYSGFTSASSCMRCNINNSIYGNNIYRRQTGFTGGTLSKWNTDETNIILDYINDDVIDTAYITKNNIVTN